MLITKDDKIMQEAILMGDGPKGSYFRSYKLTCNGEDLGVVVSVSAVSRNAEQEIKYITEEGEFYNYKDALVNAGHILEDKK